MKGLTYILRNKLYIAVTNKCVSRSPIQLRGPSFQMPATANFFPLEGEPSADDIYKAVEDAFEHNQIAVSSMDSDEITFAGIGEPLLRLDTMTTAAKMIVEKRHGVHLRLKTSGLVLAKDCSKVAESLLEAGINDVSIHLGSDNPKQYMDIVQPTNGANFSDMCCFVTTCVEAGLNVSCTAVEKPGVNIKGVRELAFALGAPTFVSSTYHA